MRSVASTPLMTGIRMSMRTTSTKPGAEIDRPGAVLGAADDGDPCVRFEEG